ncbi:GGDEF domain-containing protein [Roseibium sp.]|uniref:GGDEF domain-containing protein n=1 Tax=Roseibium sp. TaxID=1936156 RepID=UPI003B50D113
MKVTSRSDARRLILVVSVVSLFLSLLFTYLFSPPGLTKEALIPATIVPLIVAPCASYFVANMMLRMHALNQRLEYLVQFDAMTGLLNRASFFDRFENREHSGSVLICDLDHFKAINDTHGHRAGDAVLRQIADILQKQAPAEGVAARFGGEEFVLFLPLYSAKTALDCAEAIRSAVAVNVTEFEGNLIRCTISIGLCAAEPQTPLDDAIEASDKALYLAKNSGRNRVVEAENAESNDRPNADLEHEMTETP